MTVQMPPAIAALPRNKVGYPVPWFVATFDGEPDFRVIDTDRLRDAHRFSLCWVCGQRRGRVVSFVIGPMCAVNRTSAEPPSHRDCAIYSALACPFLSNPSMRRRERGLPQEMVDPAGMMILRNPGVALVWISRSYRPFPAPGGVLFELGDPIETLWFAEGREATRAEVLASIEAGLPKVRAVAEDEGPSAVAEFRRMYDLAMNIIPADATSVG